MNLPPAARGSQDAGFTQPRDHIIANPCIAEKLGGRTTVDLIKMSQPRDQPPPYQPPIIAPTLEDLERVEGHHEFQAGGQAQDKVKNQVLAEAGDQAQVQDQMYQMPPASVLGRDPGSNFSSTSCGGMVNYRQCLIYTVQTIYRVPNCPKGNLPY